MMFKSKCLQEEPILSSHSDDKRQLFGSATNFVDPLRKREDFAISLRKKKK